MTSATLHSIRNQHRSALKRFTSSPKSFDVLTTVSPDSNDTPSSSPATNVLYVLDSSFNPPTVAHLGIAGSALLENPGPSSSSSRLLLLLATQNADKPSKPASFEDRLVMMELFARDLFSYLKSANSNFPLPFIDIGVTKKPYFVDKAVVIDTSGIYPHSPEQIHLIGYDTLIRIFNAKYYPPDYTLAPLGPFLARHRLRVTVRPDDGWGGKDDQLAFLQNLARGGLRSVGGCSEWAERIRFVDGQGQEGRSGDPSVSSTKAREVVGGKTTGKMDLDLRNLESLVPRSVCDYLVSQNPYDG